MTQYSYNDNDQLTEEVTDGNVSSYEYDDNGALVKKDAGGDPNHYYSYDLRGRLAQLQVENGVTLNYLYNPDGIRVRAAVQAGSTTDYLIDPYNHTGYAQVFKEVGDSNTVYIFGLDAIAQAAGASEPKYLLYDGHGSTRQVSNTAGAVTDTFAYDAYGSAHGFNPGEAATKLLYTGEFYDSHLGFYYNRARYYNPSVGRFNRLDPFGGANHAPQSLHKYLYGHCNPMANVDPGGQFTFSQVLHGVSIGLQIYTAFMVGWKIGSILRLTCTEQITVEEAMWEIAKLGIELGVCWVGGWAIGKILQFGSVPLRKFPQLLKRVNRNRIVGKWAEKVWGVSRGVSKNTRMINGTKPDYILTNQIHELKYYVKSKLGFSKQLRKMVATGKRVYVHVTPVTQVTDELAIAVRNTQGAIVRDLPLLEFESLAAAGYITERSFQEPEAEEYWP